MQATGEDACASSDRPNSVSSELPLPVEKKERPSRIDTDALNMFAIQPRKEVVNGPSTQSYVSPLQGQLTENKTNSFHPIELSLSPGPSGPPLPSTRVRRSAVVAAPDSTGCAHKNMGLHGQVEGYSQEMTEQGDQAPGQHIIEGTLLSKNAARGISPVSCQLALHSIGFTEAARSPSPPMSSAVPRHSPITAAPAPVLLSADVCLAAATPRGRTAAAAAKFGVNVRRRAEGGDRERAAMEVELRLMDKGPELPPEAAAAPDGGSDTLWEEVTDAKRRAGGDSDVSECESEDGAGRGEGSFHVDLETADTEVCLPTAQSPLRTRRSS